MNEIKIRLESAVKSTEKSTGDDAVTIIFDRPEKTKEFEFSIIPGKHKIPKEIANLLALFLLNPNYAPLIESGGLNRKKIDINNSDKQLSHLELVAFYLRHVGDLISSYRIEPTSKTGHLAVAIGEKIQNYLSAVLTNSEMTKLVENRASLFALLSETRQESREIQTQTVSENVTLIS